jgi:hypothetical protein
MDTNKLAKLKEAGYKIERVCGVCEHSKFVAGRDFGLCMLQTYFHQKHKEKRHLSISKFGGCFRFKKKIIRELEDFERFL